MPYIRTHCTFNVRSDCRIRYMHRSYICAAIVVITPFSCTVVVVGLAAMNLTVKENETYPVCVEITSGETLERDVFIGLEVQNSSAQGDSPLLLSVCAHGYLYLPVTFSSRKKLLTQTETVYYSITPSIEPPYKYPLAYGRP